MNCKANANFSIPNKPSSNWEPKFNFKNFGLHFQIGKLLVILTLVTKITISSTFVYFRFYVIFFFTFTSREARIARSTLITFVIDDIGFTTTDTTVITCNTIWPIFITITSWNLKNKITNFHWWRTPPLESLQLIELFTFTCGKVKKPSITCITFVIDDIRFTSAYTITITCNTFWTFSITITSWKLK